MSAPDETTTARPGAAAETIDALVREARKAVDSWTLDPADAVWVATEALRRASEPAHVLSHDLHAHLRARRPYYPSAREVAAIVRAAALVAPQPVADAVTDAAAVTDDDVRRALRVWNDWPADLPILGLHVLHDRSARALRRVLEADRAAMRATTEAQS